MNLRRCQAAALQVVREACRLEHRALLVVMPTGTGKRVLFAEIAQRRDAQNTLLVSPTSLEAVRFDNPLLDRADVNAIYFARA